MKLRNYYLCGVMELDPASPDKQAQRAQRNSNFSYEDIDFHAHLIKLFSLCPLWLVPERLNTKERVKIQTFVDIPCENCF
jgi:hypothetical protein